MAWSQLTQFYNNVESSQIPKFLNYDINENTNER